MPLSTDVQVALIFGVLGILVAVASAVFAYMALKEARRKRHARDDLELQTSYGSERYLSRHTSPRRGRYALYLPYIGYGDYLLPSEMRFPKQDIDVERLHDANRPSSVQFDFRHTLR
ncbi:hypothetical protein CCHR01_08186 [Colletotrichum chrysophilum]|uniref:Uncharacterized protein n=1 Tax=Colletotrichum chrysophilum TaxID=1836956 RepID=A0AAD9AKD3_9PEZI|nr:hypothetical protein CCHR01_08186 [Colletotrichum chrysophilum]